MAWWENGPDGKAISISALAKIESGFTRSLATCHYNEVHVLIDSPYDDSINTDPYAGVTMIATGTGISAQMSYVKELLELQQIIRDTKESAHQQQISLIWELEEECKLSLTHTKSN